MRILHLVESFSPTSETFIYDSVQGFQTQGTENFVICLKRENMNERPFKNVATIHLPPKRHPLRFLLHIEAMFRESDTGNIYETFYRKRIEKIARRFSPDIIYAHFGPNAVLVLPVARKLGIPLACMFHGYDVSRLMTEKKWIRAYNRLFEKGALFMAVSEFLADKIRKFSGQKINPHIVYNGVNLSLFKPVQRVIAEDNMRINLIFVGRLVEKKDPLGLLCAFELALKKVKSGITLRLLIIGDGPLKKEVIERARKLGVSDHVVIEGEIESSKIPGLMRQAHIYVQHSITAADGDTEGLPVSILEAVATGLPVVSTRHSGIPEQVIHGETGYLVDEGDLEGMASAIVELAEDPEQRKLFGENARRLAEDKFNRERQIRMQLELFQNLKTIGAQRCR